MLVVEPVVSPKAQEGTTTVTSDQIVYQQRVRALDHARQTGNVAETGNIECSIGLAPLPSRWTDVRDLN